MSCYVAFAIDKLFYSSFYKHHLGCDLVPMTDCQAIPGLIAVSVKEPSPHLQQKYIHSHFRPTNSCSNIVLYSALFSGLASLIITENKYNDFCPVFS